MAVRAPEIILAESFRARLDALRLEYAEVDSAVEEFVGVLRGAWAVPHSELGPDNPDVFAAALDYVPLGADGLNLFLVTYHASALTDNPMQNPLRTYTLLSIRKRE